MTLLWVVAPVAIGVGVVIALVGLRRIAEASEELTGSLRRFRELSSALEDLHDAADGTLERGRRIRQR